LQAQQEMQGGQTSPSFALAIDVLGSRLQAAALEEMTALVRDASPYLAREPDLAAIYLEFSGVSEDTLRGALGLSKHEVARLVYDRVRAEMLQEQPSPAQFAPKPHPCMPKTKVSGGFFSIERSPVCPPYRPSY
jgi:hypothetical protein